MTAARVVLWRHGETDWNATGRYQGQADIPLNGNGLEQARRAAPEIAKFGPAIIASSDLTRAQQTADILARLTGVPVTIVPQLQEINVGTWVGLTNEQVFAEDPEFKRALYAGEDHRRSPTGETGAEAGSRVASALLDLAEDAKDGSTLVAVGHGFSLRVATLLLMDVGYGHNMSFGGLRNCAWNVLHPAGERWRLNAYNVTAE